MKNVLLFSPLVLLVSTPIFSHANDWDVTVSIDDFTDDRVVVMTNEGESGSDLFIQVFCHPFTAIAVAIKGSDDLLQNGTVDVRFDGESNRVFEFDDMDQYAQYLRRDIYDASPQVR